MSPKDCGMLLVSSVRYALGRRTHIVSETCRIVRESLHDVGEETRSIIERDVREALARGATGDSCDVREWSELLAWMAKAPEVKPCADCGAVLPLEAFYRLRRGEEARQARCKRCDNTARTKNMRRIPSEGRGRIERRPRVPGVGRVDPQRQPDGSVVLMRKGRV